MRQALNGLIGAAMGAAIALAPTAPQAADAKLIGSGASFPFPIYSAWFKDFSKTAGATVDYQAKGSGAGIQDFIKKTVDFAASDAAMTDEEMSKVDGGVVLLPMTAGEIVLIYNLPGVTAPLKLARDTYPEIFLGKVTKWNDPKIAATNPGVKLPDTAITVVRRSDSSGTTFVFTRHLSAISPAFKAGPGFGTSVQWPASDKIVAAPKNDGVTATVKQTPGAIGYVEYGFAKLTKAPTALLENAAKKYVEPSRKSGEAALATAAAEMPADLRAWIDDPAGDDAYPIASFTWMLFYKKQDPAKADVLRKLVDYSLTKGQAMADSMGYIPLPQPVIDKVKVAAQAIQ
jgi:phosphate transport system substrate-binding protein